MNALHSNGGSALMEAATAGNVSVVKKLVEHGADAKIRDKDAVTALMSAASQGHLEVCKLLIELGVEVDVVANSGGTALMFAAGAGYSEVCKLLMEQKADVNAKVKATLEPHKHTLTPHSLTYTPIHLLPRLPSLCHARLPHARTHKVKATPEYIEQVAEAIAKGQDDVEPHKDGVTSLHVAALGGHLEVFSLSLFSIILLPIFLFMFSEYFCSLV